MENIPQYVVCYQDEFVFDNHDLQWRMATSLKDARQWENYPGFRIFRMGELGKELRLVTTIEEVSDAAA